MPRRSRNKVINQEMATRLRPEFFLKYVARNPDFRKTRHKAGPRRRETRIETFHQRFNLFFPETYSRLPREFLEGTLPGLVEIYSATEIIYILIDTLGIDKNIYPYSSPFDQRRRWAKPKVSEGTR